MSRHSKSRAFVGAVVLLAGLVSLTGVGTAGWFCRMTGQVLSPCCCPSGDEVSDDADASDRLQAQDCCETFALAAESVPAEIAPDGSSHGLTAPTFVVLLVTWPGSAGTGAVFAGRPAFHDSGPPAHGPTLLVQRTSFLI